MRGSPEAREVELSVDVAVFWRVCERKVKDYSEVRTTHIIVGPAGMSVLESALQFVSSLPGWRQSEHVLGL